MAQDLEQQPEPRRRSRGSISTGERPYILESASFHEQQKSVLADVQGQLTTLTAEAAGLASRIADLEMVEKALIASCDSISASVLAEQQQS